MCQAVRGHTPYFRSTSRAEMPFLAVQASNTTRTQVRIGTLVTCITVPVMTEYCFRQGRHRHTRRSLMVPAAVRRLVPFFGTIRDTSSPPQWAHLGVSAQRRSSQ